MKKVTFYLKSDYPVFCNIRIKKGLQNIQPIAFKNKIINISPKQAAPWKKKDFCTYRFILFQ